ncbi:hypothetical protein IE4803_CH02272 [Rhizobium etli bv. phaseoli str. IE4803]|uniref:Uncharacterized protein n=1 Tax=Rhizobium etli bv. mimosae str. IE4771 TaxID=1432050 RepID=A0A060I6B8_RHIET|nr:hypothetical protein IE4771_CH02358 [Rhizobium sp. IE4771]AJC79468.1 hypothetical protein IE4803_CH02272 [Rhizobium etli bv. phaseoli str. IE4803]ARQ58405.1 hypothetical protein Kim5_CH02353 [Rhizobium sp. Kim5]
MNDGKTIVGRRHCHQEARFDALRQGCFELAGAEFRLRELRAEFTIRLLTMCFRPTFANAAR